jgi:hypothetical protein
MLIAVLRRWLRPPEPPPNPALEALQAHAHLVGRVDTLERELTALRGAEAQLQLDWASTLDKLNRWTAREAARQRRRAERELDALTNPTDEHLAPSPPAPLTLDASARRDKSQLRRLVAAGVIGTGRMPAPVMAPNNGSDG